MEEQESIRKRNERKNLDFLFLVKLAVDFLNLQVRRQQRQSTGSARFCVNGSLQSGCPEWPWWWGDGVERRIAGDRQCE